MFKYIGLVIGFIVITFFSTSCGEYDLLEHNKLCKRSADSLFQVNSDSLNKSFDTLCIETSDAYYKHVLDSLKQTRIDDIRKLFKKD